MLGHLVNCPGSAPLEKGLVSGLAGERFLMNKPTKAEPAIKHAFGAAIEFKTSEFPTRDCIEIGAGSDLSFSDESHGINSGDHNKSAQDILATYKKARKAILKVVGDDVKAKVAARLG